MPAASDPTRPRRVITTPDGPTLVEGPVELEDADGATITVDRFLVAVCACHRSRRFPLCDGTHRLLPSKT